jgi:hypothetical protein
MSEQGSDRLERAARNQSLFREVNERLEGLAEAFQHAAVDAVFVCECADMHCVEQLDMTVTEYETIRRDGNSFVVSPGHVYLDVETVEAENERYVVAAKVGEGGRIALENDPRQA